MLVDTLIEKPPSWFYKDAPDGAMALFCQCTLTRNLPDIPFVPHASEVEKGMVEERVVHVLENMNLMAQGRYYSLEELDLKEQRFLAERQLITNDLLYGTGPRGVYVAADQSASIMVNALDHVTIRVLNAGLQLQECWNRALEYDKHLNDILGFAFDEDLGYLTTQLRNIGTGLKASVLLHLPALTLTSDIQNQAERVNGQRLVMQGVSASSFESSPGKKATQSKALQSKIRREKESQARVSQTDKPGDKHLPIAEVESLEASFEQSLYSNLDGLSMGTLKTTLGDMYLLVNESTLGLSEDEICFHVRHAASKIMAEEREARKQVMTENKCVLEDRVGRARGIAAGARLIGFTEGLQLLSAIRLGADLQLLDALQPHELNMLMLQSQGAQLEIAQGCTGDGYRLNMERAALFRNRFSMGLER